VEPAEFEQWLADQAEDANEPQTAQEQEGYDLVGANCVVCHAVRGHENDGGARVGPDLTHFATREEYAGAIFNIEDEDQLRRWIANSQAEKPGSQMFPFPQFTDEQLDALVAYLLSLD
jgi:cytochrome c oxidase subunit II